MPHETVLSQQGQAALEWGVTNGANSAVPLVTRVKVGANHYATRCTCGQMQCNIENSKGVLLCDAAHVQVHRSGQMASCYTGQSTRFTCAGTRVKYSYTLLVVWIVQGYSNGALGWGSVTILQVNWIHLPATIQNTSKR